MSKSLIKPVVLATGLLAGFPAAAANDWNCYSKYETEFSPCYYVGAGLGISRFDPDENTSGWDTGDASDSGLMVYAGYQFHPDWFVELAYADMGDVAVDAGNPSLPSGAISYEVPNIMAGYFIDMHSLSEGEWPDLPIDPFIKAGLSAIQNSASPKGIPFEQQNDVQLALGAGFEWRFAKQWKLRNAIESYDADALFFTLSVAYIFGEGEKVKEAVRQPVEPVKARTVTASEPAQAEVGPAARPALLPAEPEFIVNDTFCNTFDGSLEGVVFKINSDELTESSKQILAKASAALQQFPGMKVEIQAYTDSQGSAEYNKKLSAKRAEAVLAFFVSQGVAESRLTAIGFGEEKPVDSNATEVGRSLNRRVELQAGSGPGCQ